MSISVQAAPTTVRLRCGTLTLHVERAAMSLDELCTFGSRRNRNRGFLFISKVLGKHVPVRPSIMNKVHHGLARLIGDVPGPTVVMTLAETATGLGHGVFEAMLQHPDRDDMLFLHSTRYRLTRELALSFRESHSHATEHLVYFPTEAEQRRTFDYARTLVMVDDELSTGRTLVNLAREYLKLNPRIESIRFVSITDWLDRERRREIANELARPVEFHSLLEGRFHFEADPVFDPGAIPNVVGNGAAKDALLPNNFGRFGLSAPIAFDFDRLVRESGLRGGERVLVLGTGEFAHAPYLFARNLEQRGWDVFFQSTTRSPILPGEGIANALEFTDNYHDAMPNYVYNLDPAAYDRIFACYETRSLPASHRLVEMLGAKALFF